MCDDENEGEGGTGDQGKQAMTLRPTDSRRRRTAMLRPDQPPEDGEVVSDEIDGEYEPSLSTFDSTEELPNGYMLSYSWGRWILRDESGRFIGEYDTREEAEEEAHRRKPWPRFGM